MIFEVLIEQASKEFILLKNLYESLEEVIHIPSYAVFHNNFFNQ